MTPPVQRAPQTDQELIRHMLQRMRALETKTTVRIGPWVLSAPDGNLVATSPGQSVQDVGQDPPDPAVIDLTRGTLVTQDDVTDAIAGTTTSNSSFNLNFTAWGADIANRAKNLANSLSIDLPTLNLADAFDPVATFLKGGNQWAQEIRDDFSALLGGFDLSAGSAPRDYYSQTALDTQNTINQMQLAIAALQAIGDNSGTGGQSYLVDASGLADSPSIGADWLQILVGTGTGQQFGVLNGCFDWANTGTGAKTAFNFYTPGGDDTAGLTDTPYQLVGALFTTKPGKRFIPGPLPWDPATGSSTFYGSDELICRWDPVSGSCVRIKRDGDGTATLIWDDGTTLTTMDLMLNIPWKANTLYFLRGGNPDGNIREYTLFEGSAMKQIYTFTDSTAIAYPDGFDPIADGYNGFGGGFADYRFGGTSGSPVKQFLLRDVAASNLLGVIGRASRTNTVTSVLMTSTDAVLSSGALDHLDYQTPGLAFTSGVVAVQTITIAGTPTGGSLFPTVPGYGTYLAGVARNASAATLQTALRTIAGLEAVQVTGGPGPGTPWVVALIVPGGGPVGLMTFTNTFTGGTSPTVGAAHTTVGVYDNCWTVRDQGNYLITCALPRDTVNTSVDPSLWVNGVLTRVGPAVANGYGWGTWVVPLPAGARLQMGGRTVQGSPGAMGDAAGLTFYMEITKLALPANPPPDG